MLRNVYDDIILKLAKKYNISDLEVERIVDSQFKVIVDTVASKDIKTLNVIYLGKFTPTKSRLVYESNKTKINTTSSDN